MFRVFPWRVSDWVATLSAQCSIIRAMIDLSQTRAFTFDCYGTLIDWETGLKGVLNAWAVASDVPARDDQVLELFAAHEARVEAEQPRLLYSDVLREVMRRLSLQLGVSASPEWVERLGTSVGDWPAFTDSADALLRLKEKYRLCILSNVDHVSFAGSRRKLIADFDLVVTAEDVGSYKPDARNFAALIGHLRTIDISPDQVVHVAQSLYHDHAPAKRLGLKSIWIDRRHGTQGFGATLPPASQAQYDMRFTSMREFAEWACA